MNFWIPFVGGGPRENRSEAYLQRLCDCWAAPTSVVSVPGCTRMRGRALLE